jgi:hypothetical protein
MGENHNHDSFHRLLARRFLPSLENVRVLRFSVALSRAEYESQQITFSSVERTLSQ